MKPRTLATLLGVCLLPTLGIGHCERGDALAFGESCIRILSGDPAPRPHARVVSLDRRVTGLSGSYHLQLEVNTCSASLIRIGNGGAEDLGPYRLEPGDAKALHDALVDAGGLDAESASLGPVCGIAVSAPQYWSDVTVYEPSALPGTAWSNAFSFGTCANSPQTDAIEQVLNEWIAAHFDL